MPESDPKPVSRRARLTSATAPEHAGKAAQRSEDRSQRPKHPIVRRLTGRHGGRMIPREHPVPDIPSSLPVGSGGNVNTNLPGSKLPPATWNHWLNGVGQLLTPTPAMVDIGTNYLIHATTINDQAEATWTKIHKKHSTV